MAHDPAKPVGRSLWRGLKGLCPRCGQGRLFYRYLKVWPHCQDCGHDLDQYPADDGPAYFTILLVGQLVVAPLLFFPFIWQTPTWIIMPATLIPLGVLSLIALPRIKGAVLGLLFALNIHRGDGSLHTADRFD
jgi:uncharacterized protein (DUF983 family)